MSFFASGKRAINPLQEMIDTFSFNDFIYLFLLLPSL